MSETAERHPVTLKRIVHHIDGMESVPVRRDIEYWTSAAGPLVMDIYRPPPAPDGPAVPAVVLIAGYRDVGVRRILGCAFKEMEMVISLAQLIAASGMAAIAYSTSDPPADAHRVLDFLVGNGDSLGIDGGRIGLWALSGNVPVALALLISRDRPPIGAAVLSSGYAFEEGDGPVAETARTYGFVNAVAGKSVEDLPADVPLFLARAGLDEFGVNESLDRLLAGAVRRNLAISFVNHASARHGFEVNDASALSRDILDRMLTFMHLRLVT